MTALTRAAERVLQGEALQHVAVAYRRGLLREMGIEVEDAPPDLFEKETMRFMNQLCRHLGDRHGGVRSVARALEEWVRRVDEFDAFDALLTQFEFEGRAAVLRRGRLLFPGAMTGHWADAEE
ncbi:MAG: hypothetical protein KDC87_21715 [Planctomycetes bacterium]|nr:hypothetical protein [Planctomycetota bacterium]MCB9872419.1 hypothetical protein [Planctomycetota bacterium]MCB9888380.1 hypothetical protein [Planctomycetota bacterium]